METRFWLVSTIFAEMRSETSLPSPKIFFDPHLKPRVRVVSVCAAKMKSRKLEFSSHTGNLALMRNFVRAYLESFPISERDRTLMVLGVDEACTNIIRHAYQLRDDKLIALSLEAQPDCVRLRLRDYGEKQPVVEELKNQRRDVIKPGGLGVHLIRRAFDQVDYILQKKGTELVLTKRLEA